MRTGESPRSVKPKPPSPGVMCTGPTNRHRFLVENTDRGPWKEASGRGLAEWQPVSPDLPGASVLAHTRPGAETGEEAPGERDREGEPACSPADGRSPSPSSGTGWALSPPGLGGSWLTGQEGKDDWNRTPRLLALPEPEGLAQFRGVCGPRLHVGLSWVLKT